MGCVKDLLRAAINKEAARASLLLPRSADLYRSKSNEKINLGKRILLAKRTDSQTTMKLHVFALLAVLCAFSTLAHAFTVTHPTGNLAVDTIQPTNWIVDWTEPDPYNSNKKVVIQFFLVGAPRNAAPVLTIPPTRYGWATKEFKVTSPPFTRGSKYIAVVTRTDDSTKYGISPVFTVV